MIVLKPPVRIVVIHPGSLGDIILSLPALRALRESYPEMHLTVIGRPAYLELLRGRTYADRVLSIDRAGLSACLNGQPADSDPMTEIFREARCVINWLPGHAGEFSKRLKEIGVRNLLSARPVSRAAGRMHRVRVFLQALMPLLGPTRWSPPRLSPSGEDKERGIEALRRLELGRHPVLAIHPGSGSTLKCWPLSRFVELACQSPLRLGMAPVFILGPAEQSLKSRLIGLPRGRAAVLDNLPLPVLAGALASCNGYVGNDSGVTHLAAALEIPVVALFGPTDPVLWGPLGSHVGILYKCREGARAAEGLCPGGDGLDRIDVDEVVGALARACLAGRMSC